MKFDLLQSFLPIPPLFWLIALIFPSHCYFQFSSAPFAPRGTNAWIFPPIYEWLDITLRSKLAPPKNLFESMTRTRSSSAKRKLFRRAIGARHGLSRSVVSSASRVQNRGRTSSSDCPSVLAIRPGRYFSARAARAPARRIGVMIWRAESWTVPVLVRRAGRSSWNQLAIRAVSRLQPPNLMTQIEMICWVT